jgi:hypothetical protein
MPTSADRGCHVVSVTDLYGRILSFLDRSRYFFFQIPHQLYSRGLVDPVPDPLLLRKSGGAGNQTRTSGSVGRNSDHQTTEAVISLELSLPCLKYILPIFFETSVKRGRIWNKSEIFIKWLFLLCYLRGMLICEYHLRELCEVKNNRPNI